MPNTTKNKRNDSISSDFLKNRMTPWPKLKFKSDFIPPQHSNGIGLTAWRVGIIPWTGWKTVELREISKHQWSTWSLTICHWNCFLWKRSLLCWPLTLWVLEMRFQHENPACHTPEKRLSGERTESNINENKNKIEQVEPLGTMGQNWSRSMFETALEDKLHYINVGSRVRRAHVIFATFWCARINLAESCNRLHQASARGLDMFSSSTSFTSRGLLAIAVKLERWNMCNCIPSLTFEPKPRDILDPAFDSVKLLAVEGFC